MVREFREYFASSYAANHKIAGRIGVTVKTLADWLGATLSRRASHFRNYGHFSTPKLGALLVTESDR
jgi:hypothetical protein